MATSPLFGWEEPDDTDLVKDGAAAIRTLGNAIDTSMGDLLGGTTGQVLSKTSNANMDFTWVTDPGGDITAVGVTSPITGGGTTGAVTIAIQDATTAQKGAVQLSDSTSTTSSILASTPTAVKSAYDLANTANTAVTTNHFAAGKNKIINGNFGVWQRGTTFTPGTTIYTADRWFYNTDLGSGATLSQQTFTPGTAPASGYEGTFFFRYARTSGTTTFNQIYQPIEDVRTFAGQTVTLSFWAKAASATTINTDIYQIFGTGGSTAVTVLETPHSITSSWQRFSATVAVPSISGKTIGTNSNLRFVFQYLTGNKTVDIWGAQLEAGSVATAFQTATGTIQGELAACQRYYWRSTGTLDQHFGVGMSVATSVSVIYVQSPVVMRTNPIMDYSNLVITDNQNYDLTVVTLTLSKNGNLGFLLNASTIASATQYRSAFLKALNSSSYLGFGAEL